MISAMILTHAACSFVNGSSYMIGAICLGYGAEVGAGAEPGVCFTDRPGKASCFTDGTEAGNEAGADAAGRVGAWAAAVVCEASMESMEASRTVCDNVD